MSATSAPILGPLRGVLPSEAGRETPRRLSHIHLLSLKEDTDRGKVFRKLKDTDYSLKHKLCLRRIKYRVLLSQTVDVWEGHDKSPTGRTPLGGDHLFVLHGKYGKRETPK